MAKMMASLGGTETQGERDVYRFFENNLPNVYRVWHNKRVHPCPEIDFIIFDPSIGIWMIEVKDWTVDYIVSPGPEVIKLLDDQIHDNPHRQVEAGWKRYMNEMSKDKNLIDERKKLKYPICKFVIYSRMNNDEVEKRRWGRVLELQNSWTTDFLTDEYRKDGFVEEALLERMKAGPAFFRPKLTNSEVDAVERFFGKTIIYDAATRVEVGELDKYQSGLIELPIESHYVIKGPAGSGKSLVLIGRAIRIARERPDWIIGIFCFNVFMANYLKTLITLDSSFLGIKDRIHVHYFDSAIRTDRNIKYDAILVDEGQDAKEEHLRYCFESLKDSGSSFTIFFDERQKIYIINNDSISEQLNSIGFNIIQEKRLVKQQRSALVVLALAVYEKINNQSKSESEILQNVIDVIAPKIFDETILNRIGNAVKSGWSSFKTAVKNLLGTNSEFSTSELSFKQLLDKSFSVQKSTNYYEDAVNAICNELHETKDAKYADFAVLIPLNLMAEQLSVELIKKNIPHEFINRNGFSWANSEKVNSDNRMTFDFTKNCVKILTIQTSKGFDCKNTIILNLEILDSNDASRITDNGKTKAQLVYVALTRAKSHCLILYKDKSNVIDSLLKFKEMMPDVSRG